MAKLIWSPQAVADLRGIYDFIARDSEHYARLFGERLVAFAETIPRHPEIGRVVPEYRRPDLRERFLQRYRIVYRVRKEAIEIVAICQGARLLPPLNLD